VGWYGSPRWGWGEEKLELERGARAIHW